MEEKIPVLGEDFPKIGVQTTHGKMILPEHYGKQGKWMVLFSHPADFTPVCTTEFYAMEQRAGKFRELGAEPIGLSIDQVFSHIKWAEWIKENLDLEISFPIIADDTGAIAKSMGMIPDGATHTARAVFVVDPKGKIRAIIYYPPEVGRDWDEVLRLVKALQTSDEKKVALPHKWPNNELIGKRMIVPPASSMKAKAEREESAKRGEIECYDWWFCHKGE